MSTTRKAPCPHPRGTSSYDAVHAIFDDNAVPWVSRHGPRHVQKQIRFRFSTPDLMT